MKLRRIISSIFFPERCNICGEIKPFLKAYCPKCGVDTVAISAFACPECGHEKCMCSDGANVGLPHFAAVYYYQSELKKSLLRFKFQGESSYSDIFGKAMAERVKELYDDITFDGVCFVPMTKRDRAKRGYNQGELLACEIAKELKIPLVPCLEKTRDTVHQKDLNATERQENIKDSFSLNENADIKGKTLILCDDIKTTGSTLRECCDVLMKGGAKDVYCVCLALTPYINYMEPF